MKARCTCTLVDTGSGRYVRPVAGYYPSKQDCSKCKGSEFFEIYFDEKKVEAVWLGICPECGEENGVHIQYKGRRPPSSEGFYNPPICMNNECSQERVVWVREDKTPINP